MHVNRHLKVARLKTQQCLHKSKLIAYDVLQIIPIEKKFHLLVNLKALTN